MKRRKLISVIPLLSFKAPSRRLDQKREHVKNTCLPTKLLSRVTDNCMNTSPVWCESMHGYFFADITQIFSACIPIVIASLNRVRKSRSFSTMQQRRQINFYNHISEKYFPSLSISNHFTFDLCLQQVWNTNLTLARLRYTSDEKKKNSYEIQILPTVKFNLHIPISLLSLKN